MGLPLPRIREATVGVLYRTLASSAAKAAITTPDELTMDRVVALALTSR
jgi:hypothetical protein